MFLQGNAFIRKRDHPSEWSEISNLLFRSLNRRHPSRSRAGEDLHIGHVIGIGLAVIIYTASLNGHRPRISVRGPIEKAAAVSTEVRCNSVAATSLARVRLKASAQNFELVQRHQYIVTEAISGQAALINTVAAKLVFQLILARERRKSKKGWKTDSNNWFSSEGNAVHTTETNWFGGHFVVESGGNGAAYP